MAKSRGQSLGTKGAVIFGDEASSGLGQNLSYIDNLQQARQQNSQIEAQRLAQSWRDNALKASTGTLWRDDIGKIEQEHLNKGIELKSRGIDPYNSLDPAAQEYRNERRQVEDMRNFAAAKEQEWKTINDTVLKKAEGYRPEDIKALQDFASNTPFSDIYGKNMQVPSVREVFKIQDAIKGVKPVLSQTTVVKDGRETSETQISVPETERAILSTLGRDATGGGQEFLASITGGYSVPEIRNVPGTIEETRTLVEGLYDSDPAVREELAVSGIVSKDDPRFQEYLDSESQAMFQAKNRFDRELGQLVESISGGVTLKSTDKPNYTEANQARAVRSEARAERAEQRAIGRYYKEMSGDDDSDGFSNGYIPYQSQSVNGSESTVVSAPAFNSRNVKIPAARISTTEAWDLSSGGQRTKPKEVIKGDVSRLAQVPFEKGGNRIVQEGYANSNPNNVEWRKVALISTKTSTGRDRDYFVPAESIQENLTKDQQKTYNTFINRPLPQSRATNTTTKKKIEW